MNGTRIALLLAAVALGGCTTPNTGSITPPAGDPNPPPADPAETVLTATGHFFSDSADGTRDRTRTAIGIDIVTRPPGDAPTEGDIKPKGPMASGAEIAAATGLKHEADSTPDALGFGNDARDTFLTVRRISSDLVIGDFVKLNAAGFVRGVGVAGNPTQDMPTSNSATFTGEAFFVPTNLTDMKGKTTMRAEFAPGGGTVSGKIDQIQTSGRRPDILGLDIVLQQTPISGSTFSGGKVGLVTAGTDTAVGTVTSSDYGGGFFGAGAAQAGGTFHFEATGVPLPGVLNPTTFEAIGAFHGSRAP